MHRTRLSLYYLVSYLTVGGAALIIAPQFFVQILFSNGNYQDVTLRFIGILLVSLALIVAQIIRRKVELLYPTTLIVRLFICAGLIGLYASSNDPLFLTLLGIVGLGVLFTSTSYYLDKKAQSHG
ncbi:MAG: hypothetical protein HY562_11130 [Ignavibacteriales bacterium]|nr:hypothetical protein [Ignavibacteriales bacterium]